MKSRPFRKSSMAVLSVVAALLMVTGIAFATITLDTSQVQKFQVGTSTVESDDTASAVVATTDFTAGTITARVDFGTDASGFVAGARAHSLTITINATTGQVAVSDGRKNLQLTSAQQAAVKSFLTGFQDQLEQAIVSWDIVNGTQNPN